MRVACASLGTRLTLASSGSLAQRFTAEPLVYSPIGEFVRSWWVATAAKLNMVPNTQCSNPIFQKVLDQYGTLNWLLFKWEPTQLHGDEIIRLLTHGPQVLSPSAHA